MLNGIAAGPAGTPLGKVAPGVAFAGLAEIPPELIFPPAVFGFAWIALAPPAAGAEGFTMLAPPSGAPLLAAVPPAAAPVAPPPAPAPAAPLCALTIDVLPRNPINARVTAHLRKVFFIIGKKSPPRMPAKTGFA